MMESSSTPPVSSDAAQPPPLQATAIAQAQTANPSSDVYNPVRQQPLMNSSLSSSSSPLSSQQQSPPTQENPTTYNNNTTHNNNATSSSVNFINNNISNRINNSSTAPQRIEGHIDVKLFVGRLPTTTTDESIRPIFEEFGKVTEVVVIRDKATGAHKGSAFVRMASIRQADAAIRTLSNSKVLDPSLGAIQISYAVGEPERLGFSLGALAAGEDEAKVFVGSLPRDVTENDVVQFFSNYGKCYDPYLMRDSTTKRFKGCGFIKFEQKEEALLAISALHGIVTFPRASRPLEARIAEPKRPGGTVGASGGNRGLLPSGGNNWMATTAAGTRAAHMAQAQIQTATPHRVAFPVPQQQSIPHLNANPRTVGAWKEYFTADGRPYYHNCQTLLTQWDVPKEFAQAFATIPPPHPQHGGASGGGGYRESEPTGPPGANIFVFHVPNEWGKEDLAAHFAQFGYVVSAMVAMDHTTQRNKGYGFVSYDSVRSALNAVQGMNLLPVGNKRLRVAIKNGEKEHARCYAEQHGIPFPEAANDPANTSMHSGNTSGSIIGDRQQQAVSMQQQPVSMQQQSSRAQPSGPQQQQMMVDLPSGANLMGHPQMSAGPGNAFLPQQQQAGGQLGLHNMLGQQQQQAHLVQSNNQPHRIDMGMTATPANTGGFGYGTYPLQIMGYGQSDRISTQQQQQQSQAQQQRFGQY